MAKTKGVSKSAAVREYLTANPDAKVKAVVEAMAGKGTTVSEQLVYGIMGEFKEKRKRKKRVAKAAMAAATKPASNGQAAPASKADAITLIRAVRNLAQQAGGFEKLKELVDALAE
jgi:hypothetical protein